MVGKMKHQSIYRLPRVAELTATLAIALTLFSSAPALAVVSASGGTSVAATAANTCAIGKISSISVGTGINGSDSGTNWGDVSSGQSFSDNAGVRAVSWANLFNPTTAVIAAADYAGSNMDDSAASRQMIVLSFPAFCNYATTRVALKSAKGGMRLASLPSVAPGSLFRNAIAYRAVASWGRGSAAGDSSAYVNSGTTGTGGGSDNGNVFGSTGGTAAGAWTPNGNSSAARNATVNLRIAPKLGMIVPTTGYTSGTSGAAQTSNTLPFLAGTYTDTLSVRVGNSFP